MIKHAPIACSSSKKISLPLHTAFSISKASLVLANNVLVMLQDDNGLVGIGEAAPFPVLTGDDQGSVLESIDVLLKKMNGLSPFKALTVLHSKYWQDYDSTPTARVGVEMALFDLYARQLGFPLASLWGRASLSQVATDITLPIMESDRLGEFWTRFNDFGFPYFKIKVGAASIKDDVDRIQAFSRLIPEGSKLFLDGNQGFTVESALNILETLKSYDINPLFVEQPLAADDWQGMIRLTECSPVPICADETVTTMGDAKRLIEDKAAHMINLKITKSGIRESLCIAQLAKAHNIGLMIGGMVETEIAMTASIHLVCATGIIGWCDLDTPFFIEERITTESPYHHSSALLRLPTGHGLGLTLNPTLAEGMRRE